MCCCCCYDSEFIATNGRNNVHRTLILKRHEKWRRKRSTKWEDNTEIKMLKKINW